MLSPSARAGGKARDFCRVSANLPRVVCRAALVSLCLTSGLELGSHHLADRGQKPFCCGLPGL